jgi:hypothetical protein
VPNFRHTAIQLKDSDFIAKGSHNLVYRHPESSDCLIKVLGIVKVLGLIKTNEPIRALDQRFLSSKWLGTLKINRLINSFRLKKAHIREFKEILRLRFAEEFLFLPPSFMQKIVGFVDTNLGYAMVVKAEKDFMGNYAPTLDYLVRRNKIEPEMEAKFETFYQQMLRYDFILSDLHLDNIVYAYDEMHGNHFVLIDGIGDKNLVPLLSWSRYLRKRNKLSKINKLKSRMTQYFKNIEYENEESLKFSKSIN